MRRRFDLSSFLAGIASATILAFALGAMQAPDAPVAGRFQIDASHEGCYMVDTATGQAWSAKASIVHSSFFESKVKEGETK